MTRGSVTVWIERVKEGDVVALEKLWERYYRQLLSAAQAALRLRSGGRILKDEEDVVLDAFDAFYSAAKKGRYPDVRDRGSLWRLLLTIAMNKVRDEVRRGRRQKHGGGRVRGASALVDRTDLSTHQGFSAVISDQPTPEFGLILTESFEQRLTQLGEHELKVVAILKMEGYQNSEIAEKLNVSVRTIERRLSLIKRLWSTAVTGPD